MSRRRTAAGCLATVCAILLATAACTVNPVTGESQLDLMGEAQEVRLGSDLYPRYTESSLGEVPDAELQQYVDDVGQRLAAVGHRPSLPYRFNAVNEPAVNAYALPGGKISITRGLLSRFETEDELAAVLGHETGHVTARHTAQQYTRSMLLQALLVGGQIYMEHENVRHRELYAFGGMIGAQLALARYSREHERQSDDLAIEYMVAAGYNPEGVIRVMEVLGREHQREPSFVERLFASHPMPDERVATARARVAELPPGATAAPLDARSYQRRTERVREARPAYDQLMEARRLMGSERAGEALPLLQRSADAEPDDGVLRAFLAACLAELERPAQAMREAARASDDTPGVFFIHAFAGQIFFDQERYAETLRSVDRAEAVLPDVVSIDFLRARTLEATGRRAEAVEIYRGIVRRAPGTEVAQASERRLQALGAA